MTCFRYLLTNTLFHTGQWSSFVIFSISFPLSLFSVPQSYNRCSTVWVPLPQGHSGDSIILNRLLSLLWLYLSVLCRSFGNTAPVARIRFRHVTEKCLGLRFLVTSIKCSAKFA